MSGEVVVKVSWGPRPESSRELAVRWLEALRRLTELSAPDPVGWRWDAEDGKGAPVPAGTGEFAAVVEAGGPEEDADILGRQAAVVGTWPDGSYAYLRAKGGGSDAYTPFTATLQLFPASGATAGSAHPLAGRLPDALAALAESWEADTGLAYDRPLFNAIRSAFGLRNSQPRCGWATYLSANRAALVPEDLPGARHTTTGGGLVLDSGRSTQAVEAAQRALAGAGALEPLTASAPRPAW
ncbi:MULTISPECIES: hypothetical protein [unclassified Streptomyces]|uniref:hypothetical protein n=1 Tax=unclassified Streptomyces TaxID=2593676 RepID=UPI00093A78CC|nr:hypothetical protein [Streptomyces sp. CB02058]OKI97934.1 hypothetical protein AMK10_03735 [Streptomyces sp. CB02058]